MKKLLVVIALCASIQKAHSQFYTFSDFTDTYTTLTGGTVISQPGWDYYSTDTVPFPFQFKYFGADVDTFYLSGGFGGFEYFGQGVYGNYELFFYDAPVMDMGVGISPISYFVTGNAPNRILKLQMENVGFVNDQTFSDYFELQVWFYETTNVIEIHFGPNSVQNSNSWYTGYDGPTIALVRDTATFLELSGPASGPTASTSFITDFITGSPAITTVYQFTPLTNGIRDMKTIPVSVYPNPSEGSFMVNAEGNMNDAQISIFDITGKLILNQNIGSGKNNLQLNAAPGMYILKVQSAEGEFHQQLMMTR